MEKIITPLIGVLLQMTAVRVCLILLGSVMAAMVARKVFSKAITLLLSKTETELDDHLAHVIRTPVFYSILLVGVAWALMEIGFKPSVQFVALGVVKTLAVVIWGSAAMRGSNILLEALSRQMDRFFWIQPKTLPLFEIVVKILVVGGSLYFAFVAWNVNLTSWIASAGIVGIAVGFAAKDTLSNLFAGVFILADSPYKIGDFIVLDNGIRGMVTDIGIRSTRLITRDDVEVTLPNALIANSKIVNETGGPFQKMRVRVKISVSYGSDVDNVREILHHCIQGIDHICDNPEPRVRFREFGGSGLLFELLVWVEKPVFRGRVLDQLNTIIYKRFNEEDIEIPYSKHDLYIKEIQREE
jgi:MscS family membrane protein